MSDETTDIIPVEDIQISDSAVVNKILSRILRKESNLSYSALSAFMEGPREFIKYKLRQREQTEAMQYGAMVHCLTLEPEDFYNRYFVLDDEEKKKEIGGAKPTATKAYKDWVLEMKVNAGSKEMVSAANHKMASQIAMDVRFNEASARILSLCPNREQEMEYDFGNYKWRGFKDGSGKDAIFDLKTCQDANPDKFLYDIYKMGYYIQGFMYLLGDSIIDGEPRMSDFRKDYYIIAVDKKAGISCHQLKPNYIERGRKEFEFYVNKFSECILTDGFDKSYEFFAQRYDGIYDADRTW